MPYEILDSGGGMYEILPPSEDKTTFGQRIAQGIVDPINGGAQLLTHILPTSVVDAGNSLNNWLADKTGLFPRLQERGVTQLVTGGPTGVDKLVQDQEAAYQAARGQNAGSFDPTRILGNVVSPANLALASSLPMGATLAGKVGAGAMGGAASSLLNPVTQGNYADDKLKQVGTGAAFGAAVPAVTSALARVVSPAASTNSNVQLLKNEGVTPTVGQSMGGVANRIEEKLQSLPIMGDAISSARGRAMEDFNKAAINRAVAPIGQKVEGTGQEAVRQAGDLISSAYDKAKGQLGAFRIDEQAASDLSSLRQLAQGLNKPERQTINNYFNNYLGKGALTAESFKELDSKLASDIRRFSGSSDAYQQQVGDALSQVRSIITQNAMRANPQAASALKAADTAYANLVRVEGAAKAGMNNGGIFTPAQLNMAVRQADSSVRDRATARGTALMQDLSTAGQQVLGNRVPNSGTTDRLLLNALVGGGGAYVHPGIPLGLLGGAGLYSSPVQGLLSKAVTSRPQLAQPIAEALRQSSPAFVPLGAQVGLGLLN